MHSIVFTPVALAESIEAQDWYEKESPGLGGRFVFQVEAVVERISANPMQFPLVYRTVRRALLRQFPYALLFVVQPARAVTIIACFHGSRDPVRWQTRA